MQQAALYHPYPLVLLNETPVEDSNIFIEANECLKDHTYIAPFLKNRYKTILDCGVGATPDLNNPTAHIANDPHWGIKYIKLLMDLEPNVVVIPDILGNAEATWENFRYYNEILYHISGIWEQMYVIQGQTREEAEIQIKRICKTATKWVGFPRIVHYYNSTSTELLSVERIEFVDKWLSYIQSQGKHVHLLGLNNIHELEWAAYEGLSIDTRSATLAAVNNYDVTEPRPSNTVNADLCAEYSEETKTTIRNNMKILNEVFDANTVR